MLPQKNLKSRSSENVISSILGIKKHAVFVAFKNLSVVVEFAFFINTIFIFINEIQTDGDDRSYRRR